MSVYPSDHLSPRRRAPGSRLAQPRALLILGALVLWSLSACQSLLGIEDRALDLQALSDEGYPGCEPEAGECSACINSWHQCVCDDWGTRSEGRVRLSCAKEAPQSVRQKAIDDAEAMLADSKKDDDAGTGVKDPPDASTPPDGSTPPPVTPPPLPTVTPPPPPITVSPDICANPHPSDQCLTCFCDSCGGLIDRCQKEGGCGPIFNCILGESCDPLLLVGNNACYSAQFCSAVIDQHGGPTGDSYLLYQQTLLCSANNACPCGEEPCGGEDGCDCGSCVDDCLCRGSTLEQCEQECDLDPVGCTPDRGCECVDCMAQCVCEGTDVNTCEDECNPAPCSPESGCNCGNCVDDCLCLGNDEVSCSSQCEPPLCSPESDCNCDSCLDSCLCEGFLAPECQTLCGNDCSAATGCNCGSCLESCMCDGGPPIGCQAQCSGDTCVQDQGCDCGSCLDSCICNGGTLAACRDACNKDGLPCTSADGCNCGSCWDTCICNGGTSASCGKQCTTSLEPTCTQGDGCSCESCVDTCFCMGLDSASCQGLCAGRPGSKDCTAYDQCAGCFTCTGQCVCERSGAEFNSCAKECGSTSCQDGNCDACDTCQGQCECNGADPAECMRECQGLTCAASFTSTCDSCSCERCTTAFAMCEELAGCRDVLQCMRDTQCLNLIDCNAPSACAEAIQNAGGLDSHIIQIVESVQSCRVANGCECFAPIIPGLGM